MNINVSFIKKSVTLGRLRHFIFDVEGDTVEKRALRKYNKTCRELQIELSLIYI